MVEKKPVVGVLGTWSARYGGIHLLVGAFTEEEARQKIKEVLINFSGKIYPPLEMPESKAFVPSIKQIEAISITSLGQDLVGLTDDGIVVLWDWQKKQWGLLEEFSR